MLDTLDLFLPIYSMELVNPTGWDNTRRVDFYQRRGETLKLQQQLGSGKNKVQISILWSLDERGGKKDTVAVTQCLEDQKRLGSSSYAHSTSYTVGNHIYPATHIATYSHWNQWVGRWHFLCGQKAYSRVLLPFISGYVVFISGYVVFQKIWT